jgi:hypothetical protein
MQTLMGLSLKHEGCDRIITKHEGCDRIITKIYEGWCLTVTGQMTQLLWTLHLDNHVGRGFKCS